MKLFTAKLKNGQSVVTVMAEGHCSAGAEIKKQLNSNPSRRPYLKKWIADGMIVQVRTGYRVYHTNDWSLNTPLHFMSDEELKEFKPKRSDYQVVATTVCEGLEDVFRLTNHIDREWWKNPEVTLNSASKSRRSTSVGDLVEEVDSEKLWLCASVGWAEVEWEEDVDNLPDGSCVDAMI
jgi:hypothetical protein